MSSFLTLLESVNVLVVLWYLMKLMHLLIVKYSKKARRVKVKLINTYKFYCLGNPKPDIIDKEASML